MEAVFAVPFYAEGKFSFPSRQGWASIRENASCAVRFAAALKRAARGELPGACDARMARWAVPGGDGEEGFSIARVLLFPPVRRAAALRWPRGDACMARWAVPGGDGEEKFSIAHVLAWPPLRRGGRRSPAQRAQARQRRKKDRKMLLPCRTRG